MLVTHAASDALQRAISANARTDLTAYATAMAEHDAALVKVRALRERLNVASASNAEPGRSGSPDRR